MPLSRFALAAERVKAGAGIIGYKKPPKPSDFGGFWVRVKLWRFQKKEIGASYKDAPTGKNDIF